VTADDLRRCGEALYGPRFQRTLANVLGINERTIRRWVTGDRPVPPGVQQEIARLLKKRAAKAARLAADIHEDISNAHQ
jgi:DNA-binding transcriptional regulator YdaS (Cro superfamily)